MSRRFDFIKTVGAPAQIYLYIEKFREVLTERLSFTRNTALLFINHNGWKLQCAAFSLFFAALYL